MRVVVVPEVVQNTRELLVLRELAVFALGQHVDLTLERALLLLRAAVIHLNVAERAVCGGELPVHLPELGVMT